MKDSEILARAQEIMLERGWWDGSGGVQELIAEPVCVLQSVGAAMKEAGGMDKARYGRVAQIVAHAAGCSYYNQLPQWNDIQHDEQIVLDALHKAEIMAKEKESEEITS